MISVIVPAYNAGKNISGCIDALLQQTMDSSSYEIIVVDDGSTDDTAEVVGKYPKIRLIRQENQGPAAARNHGARLASGEIILFTDSDCTPGKDWIFQMSSPFNGNSVLAGVKGAYRTYQKEITARFVQIEYEDKYELLSKFRYIDFIDTYSAGFRKNAFLAFGGYDTSFPVACAEDVELTYRMHAAGNKMIFNPMAVVAHIHPDTWIGYLKKKYKFAHWRILAMKKNPQKIVRDTHTPQVMKLQLLFPPTMLLLLGSAILSAKFIFALIGLTAAFVISTIPFSYRAFKKDPVIGALSPLFLAGRSVSQFLGVISGILKHCILRK